MVFETIHRATGLTLYFRITDWHSKQVWNNVTNEWGPSEDSDADAWQDTAIAITEDPTGSGNYPIERINVTGSGTLNITVYEQDGESPANTDEVVYGNSYYYGSIFGF